MEIFVDFGLFEILVASGLVALSKAIYRTPVARWATLVASIVAPMALLLLVRGDALRWIAATALGTSVVNVSMILGTMRTRTSAV